MKVVMHDITGQHIVYPNSWPHVYTYNDGNKLMTDTIADPATKETYVKTYTWHGNKLVAESGWVKE